MSTKRPKSKTVPTCNGIKSLQVRKAEKAARIKGIGEAARKLGVHRNHLRWVIQGVRISPVLLSRYNHLKLKSH